MGDQSKGSNCEENLKHHEYEDIYTPQAFGAAAVCQKPRLGRGGYQDCVSPTDSVYNIGC